MRSIATSLAPARPQGAPEPGSSELAVSALRRMKGCLAVVEGIDECAIAYLAGLSAITVEALVQAWDPSWGFPTVSRLASLRDCLDGRPAPSTARKARDAA